MAVYKKLLLSAGGGIISSRQQAEQVKNTATILIGLGGTGIDCLRTIKTQVYTRLKPDNPDDVTPRYEHIRFLGVDTDEKSRKDSGSNENLKAGSTMTLADTEFFSIGNPDVRQALASSKVLEKRPELSWLRWENISAPNLSLAGAGGIRQVGRFMMMDKSESFISRLEQEIEAAKKGVKGSNGVPVYIHIFSGLSGGTGAGSFLDVCYMVKAVASGVGGVTTFGYFFLPDVNLSRIPYSENATRTYIQQNGYASMQELDYCMQLQFNGGGFVQEYEGKRKIEWKEQPVDMCHLICATDQEGNVIAYPYEYAMNVAAEYVMDFLTQPTNTANFGLDSQHANFVQKINTKDAGKTIGSNLSYCIIGASCAVVPLREINTYLASESFHRFSGITGRVPERRDVEQFAIDALAKGARNLDDIYKSLYAMALAGTGEEYDVYEDDWTYVRDYGNSDFELHFTNQTAAKEGQIETNVESMVDEGNEGSLLGLIKQQLLEVVADLDRGPIFAQNLLSASRENNFLNIIDGLMEQNRARYDAEKAQENLRERDLEQAKAAFERQCKQTLFKNIGNAILHDAQKKFGEYENYRMLLEQHELLLYIYEKMNGVFIKFREQVAEIESTYYAKLARVMDTLVQTFRENENALLNHTTMATDHMFEEPMMTIQELKPSLDARIDQMAPKGLFDMFMRKMSKNKKEWEEEDENKIARLVTDFFTKDAFGDFAGRTITAFLEDKYNIHNNDALLSDKIYDEWMEPLTVKAMPLFYFNNSFWKKEQCSELASLSVPEISAPIKNAAARMYENDDKWKVKESALTDRIYVMRNACALPLCSYRKCSEYEKVYSSSYTVGCHYYEGKPVEGMKFNDWRKLPSIIPQSLIELDGISERMKKITARGQRLYEEAKQYGLFDELNRICRPDNASLDALSHITGQCNKSAKKLSNPAQLEKAEILLGELKEAKKISMIPTGYEMPNAIAEDVQQDYFVSSPVFCSVVEDIVSGMKKTMQEAEEAEKNLEGQITKIKVGGKEMKAYFDALFTGVLTHEARTVFYKNEDTYEDIMLSKRGDEFPFYEIPPYQGYVSYKKLPERTKEEIKEAVDRCFDEDESRLDAEGRRLKEIFTAERFEGWKSKAEDFAEQSDIKELLKKLEKGFSDHCMTL